MRAILTKCVCIARPRFLTISFTGHKGYDRTVRRSFSIVHVLLDLLLLITNWACDAHICVESSIDSDSKWTAALININPVYPLRVSLYHYNRIVGAYYPPINRFPREFETVPVKLYSDCLRREMREHALCLHVATKFFPFGQNPYGGEMRNVAQCFRACSYYHRYCPDMCGPTASRRFKRLTPTKTKTLLVCLGFIIIIQQMQRACQKQHCHLQSSCHLLKSLPCRSQSPSPLQCGQRQSYSTEYHCAQRHTRAQLTVLHAPCA